MRVVNGEPEASAPGGTARRAKMIAKVIVTLVLCGMLYRAADWRAVIGQVTRLDGRLLALALVLFVPQTILSAWRWKRLIAGTAELRLVDAVRHTLAASALNLVVPSKLGDFSKAALVTTEDAAIRGRLAKFVAIEKVADLAALLLMGLACYWPVLGILLLVIALTVGTVSRSVPFALSTGLLWFLHLAQVHAFILAAGVDVSWTVSFSRVPIALFAGIVPAAFCGIGTRDAALVWLFADVASPATMAVVGLLTALRYLVPGAVGIPLLWTLQRRDPQANRPSQPARQADRRPSRILERPAFERSATL